MGGARGRRWQVALLALTASLLVAWGPCGAPSEQALPPGGDEGRTLASLRQIDAGLFAMTFHGGYDPLQPLSAAVDPDGRLGATAWACSLFTTRGRGEPLYGRNFDWDANPALLLFTRPRNGPASVSMVDISYLGVDGAAAGRLLADRGLQRRLLRAPSLPFDGMNEHGLAVGMAAVPEAAAPRDPARPTIGSVRVLRLVLDGARTVDEGVEILRRYNIDFAGGPPLHYLLADASGRSAVVELVDRQLRVLPNERPWHVAVNFALTGATDSVKRDDRRYQTIMQDLEAAGGTLSVNEALRLLERVTQPHTRWSVVYGMQSGSVHLVRERRFERVHTFRLDTARG